MKFTAKTKLLYTYLKRYKLWALLGAFFMITGVILLIPTPLLTMYLIDTVLPKSDISMLTYICLLCILILILNGVCNNFQNYYFNKFNYKVIFDIQLDILEVFQLTSSQYRQQKQTGYLMSRINDDPNRLQNLFADTYISILKDFITLIIGSSIIFVLHWKLALISLILLPIFIYTLQKFGKKIKNISATLFEYNAQFVKKLQESISLLDTFIVFNAEKYDTIKLLNYQKKTIRTGIKKSIIQNLASSLVSIISGLGPLLVLWYGISEIIHNRLTLGQLIAFNSFLGYIFGPTSRLISTFLNMQQALAAWDRVFDVLTKSPLMKKSNQSTEKIIEGEICFKNVNLHLDEKLILNNINFIIPKKQTIAIVGESGGGKSSLISLITQINQHSSGKLLIDNVDINELNSLRKQIALVQQEPVLFADTIKNNIKIGKFNATDDEVLKATRIANIHDFIMSLPNQYNTLLNERGMNMSIGQKQRIAIARCIIRNPAIFIMDEPTSNLDADTEKNIMSSLSDFIKSRTTIIIAHKLSSITFADKIIVIEKGQIVEEGTHEELVLNNKNYSKLWYLQQNYITN